MVTVIDSSCVRVYSFLGLLRATEYNAYRANVEIGNPVATVYAQNALLTAHAALEALVQESAFLLHPTLYQRDKKEFLGTSLVRKFAMFLEADERDTKVPASIGKIAAHRVAISHSEPDNERSRSVGVVVTSRDAARYAREVREAARWLWLERRPAGVATDFDKPNPYLPDNQQFHSP